MSRHGFTYGDDEDGIGARWLRVIRRTARGVVGKWRNEVKKKTTKKTTGQFDEVGVAVWVNTMSEQTQAPVTREHRQAAADALLVCRPLSSSVVQWIATGDSLCLIDSGHSPFAERLPGVSQAIADEGAKLAALQARVRECITELRATGGDQNVLGWLERGLVESEKARTNG